MFATTTAAINVPIVHKASPMVLPPTRIRTVKTYALFPGPIRLRGRPFAGVATLGVFAGRFALFRVVGPAFPQVKQPFAAGGGSSTTNARSRTHFPDSRATSCADGTQGAHLDHTELPASGNRRVVGRPGVGRFQLGSDADEEVLPAVGGGELDADGEAVDVAV
jgi:hypothetical protein